jgi:flagellar P-ring protein precursor FlgI
MKRLAAVITIILIISTVFSLSLSTGVMAQEKKSKQIDGTILPFPPATQGFPTPAGSTTPQPASTQGNTQTQPFTVPNNQGGLHPIPTTVQPAEQSYSHPVFTDDMSKGRPKRPSMRIKDITHVRGVCNNQLVGYGIVAGLNGTGDRKGLCENTISTTLKNLGVATTPTSDFKPKNMAAVLVTASLPAFAKSGDSIDVTVSSIGDATSLEGGTLFMTPLKGANGAIYATAQGPISTGGLNSMAGKKGFKNFTLTGNIMEGGLVCRDMRTELTKDRVLYLVLNEPDFNTAAIIAQAINRKVSGQTASAIDAQTVRINTVYDNSTDAVQFMADINNLEVTTESVARVVINERTGTVVVGGDVRIMPSAISHGSLDISIGGLGGRDTMGSKSKVSQNGRVFYLGTGASVKTLVEMLNYLGTSPRDIISILEALKKAQALPAELVVM